MDKSKKVYDYKTDKKMADRLYERYKKWYVGRTGEWSKYDHNTIMFWLKVFPILIMVPLQIFLLKLLFVDYLLNNKGFEYTVVIFMIIMMAKPMIQSASKKAIERMRNN